MSDPSDSVCRYVDLLGGIFCDEPVPTVSEIDQATPHQATTVVTPASTAGQAVEQLGAKSVPRFSGRGPELPRSALALHGPG